MPSNELPAPALRQPRLLVLANGEAVDSAIAAIVVSNNHYAADRFTVTVALGDTPAAAWASSDDLLIAVQFSMDGGMSWRELVQGNVDQLDLDPIRRVVTLCGRDLTARLIEARTREAFANRTASEIAEELAARHGLSTAVQRTTTPVGRYWLLQHDRITLDQFSRATTEWDLLVILAQFEGFDVWVAGTTLHFQPARAPTAPVVTLRPVATPLGPANVTSLRLERSLTLARDIEVVVKSWNARQQNAFVQTARARRARRDARGRAPEVQRYVYVVPNLTPEEALQLAQRKLAELTLHERVILAEMPGELDLAPRMQLRLEGTFTDFDQVYWIDEIERHLHVTRGFGQTVRARNASEAGAATAPAEKTAV